MDSVFVMTQNPPQNISDKEMVLLRPTFLDEVRTCARKRGGAATIGPNYLRAIAEEIGRRYDRLFNAYRNVVPHDFAGRICESDEDVANTVHEMFQARYPAIYQRYYESILRSRPFTTKVIYFSGSQEDAAVFQKLGIREISAQEVPDHLGKPRTNETKIKSKKIVAEETESKHKLESALEPKLATKSDLSNSQTLEKLAALSEPVATNSVFENEQKPAPQAQAQPAPQAQAKPAPQAQAKPAPQAPQAQPAPQASQVKTVPQVQAQPAKLNNNSTLIQPSQPIKSSDV